MYLYMTFNLAGKLEDGLISEIEGIYTTFKEEWWEVRQQTNQGYHTHMYRHQEQGEINSGQSPKVTVWTLAYCPANGEECETQETSVRPHSPTHMTIHFSA